MILSRHFPSLAPPDLADALVSNPGDAERIGITPIFLAGWTISLLGNLLRFWCYRSLGRLFTFDLTVRNKHELITTGPYAVVRHPSYLGTAMVAAGNMIMFFGSGSWWKETNVIETTGGKILTAAYAVTWAGITGALWARMNREDAVLRNEFGANWEAWSRKTPHKLIPFIY